MDKFPFAKFFSPFTVKFKIRNVKVGVFTNALANYYAALAEENNQGLLIRHSHLVIEPVKSLDETDPKDPLNQVCVFQGIERAAPWRKHTLDYVGQGSLSGSLDVSATILTLNSEPALYPTLIIFNDVGYFIAFAEDCATLPIAK
ncbi:hypothetical protein PIIN_11509 [Serendipita indica DSM 11827]|uniref:Uncharacterized protein n=1 Tax=Serendipita indica (strain DSM 11827) TaxID=1109443 RepID=G4U1T9_SERID|nr:hypothetical protein PIIN_11509 [Serendipita indica DSM 11827]